MHKIYSLLVSILSTVQLDFSKIVLLKMHVAKSYQGQSTTGTSNLVILLIFGNLLGYSRCTDDYEYLARIYKQQERVVRSQSKLTFEALENGALYSIESVANNLYLTAKNGFATPGPCVLKRYFESGSQLWTIIKYDTSRGYNLKPLSNEFNEVTSTLENNAHAYNAWEFKLVEGSKTHHIIFNTITRRCLQTAMLKEPVQFVKCQPGIYLQHWKLHRVE